MKKYLVKFICFGLTLSLVYCFFNIQTYALSAKSAIVVEASTGIVVYEYNADEILPEASTTKIMTALIALENCPNDYYFIVSDAAANVEGSQIGLLSGDKVKLSDLLFMLMLRSGNDAAHTIAEGVGGSVEKFVEMMNRKAISLGCTSTHFSNPHGLPDNEHFTTARDLAIISADAYQNENFRKIVSSHKVKLDYMNLVLENSNKLLETYEYANGMKTGFTKAAGRCLVSSAEKDGISLICVTLNAPDDWNDHISLLEDCFTRVEKTVVYDTGKYKISVPSLGGKTDVEVINTEPVYGLKINGNDVEYSFTENLPVSIFAPIDAGTTVGHLVVDFENNRVGAVPMAVCRTVDLNSRELSFFERFFMKFADFWL